MKTKHRAILVIVYQGMREGENPPFIRYICMNHSHAGPSEVALPIESVLADQEADCRIYQTVVGTHIQPIALNRTSRGGQGEVRQAVKEAIADGFKEQRKLFGRGWSYTGLTTWNPSNNRYLPLETWLLPPDFEMRATGIAIDRIQSEVI